MPVFRSAPDWRWVLVAAGLAIVLVLTAALLAVMTRSSSLVVLLEAVAYFATGLIIRRRRPALPARDAGIGGAIAGAALASLELGLFADQLGVIPRWQIALGFVWTVAVAFGLTWAGARFAVRHRARTAT